MNQLIEYLKELAPLITAVSVFLAALGIWINRLMAQSAFENQLAKEYRELIREIPVDVLIGKKGFTSRNLRAQDQRARENIFNYLDLCNEQVYLRRKGRIRSSTWKEWSSGMRDNLRLPMFEHVWIEIKDGQRPVFTELQTAEHERFENDPFFWWMKGHNHVEETVTRLRKERLLSSREKPIGGDTVQSRVVAVGDRRRRAPK